MGLKGKILVAVGTGLVLTVAGWLGYKKERDERNEKIQKTIREVDLKEEPKIVNVMTTEELVDDAMKTMDVGEEEMIQVTDTIMEAIAKEMDISKEELVKQGEAERDKLKGKSIDEILKMQEEFDQTHGYVIIRNGVEIPATKEEWDAENKRIAEEAARKREEQLKNGEWLKEVEKAKADKNYSKLEDLFDEKYNPYPYHPAPSGLFYQASNEGLIDEKTLNGARKYYGRLWDYSGD